MTFITESDSFERHRFKRIFNKKSISLAVLTVFIGLLIIGYLYEQGEARVYLSKKQGKSINVNQVDYNYELFGQGEYTVVINSSSGESILHREALKAKFQGNARLFFYERPGYPSSKGEFKTPKEVAQDLHFMFRRFGFEMKFIFVGEEYGSLVMQEYLNLYPDEVIGGIFINPIGESLGTPNLSRYVGRETASFLSKTVLGYAGLPRIMQNTGLMDFYNHMIFRNQEEKNHYANLMLSKGMMDIVEKEFSLLNEKEPIVVQPGILGESPLVVMTSDKNTTEFNQSSYLDYSMDSELFIYPDSIKDVVFQQPEDITSILNGLIKKITRKSFE